MAEGGAVSKERLERATFVGANMDEVVDPQERVENAERAALLRKAKSKLPARYEKVLDKRFPPDGSAPQTQEAIAEELGISRTRIKQIQDSALRRLKNRLKEDPSFADYIGVSTREARKVEKQTPMRRGSGGISQPPQLRLPPHLR